MLRPRLSPIRQFPRILRRNLHHISPLPPSLQNGIHEFLTRDTIDIAWTQYQTLMLNRLDDLTDKTEYESEKPKKILLRFARQPEHAPVFNYASMAHNNEFFFKGLSPREAGEDFAPTTIISEDMKERLEVSFSSMESLRREFILTASSMFGPGFVWLVQRTRGSSAAFHTKQSEYALLTTYLAGSPYPGAHYRRQSADMNTRSEPMDARDAHLNSAPTNRVGSMGPLSASENNRLPPGGFSGQTSIIPLLCINTWEHVWVPDYGVAGKFEYASRWWNNINWRFVESNVQEPGEKRRLMT